MNYWIGKNIFAFVAILRSNQTLITKSILWSEKTRPNSINDCVLPPRIKEQLISAISKNEVADLLLSGTPGTGKTTSALAIVKELGAEYLMVRGSIARNIDTLRNEITEFAAAVSMRRGQEICDH